MTTPPLVDEQGRFVGQCNATPQQCAAATEFVTGFSREVSRTASNNLGFLKLDWRPTARDSFSASFNGLNWNSPNGIQTGARLTNGAGVGSNGNSEVKTCYARAAWTGARCFRSHGECAVAGDLIARALRGARSGAGK